MAEHEVLRAIMDCDYMLCSWLPGNRLARNLTKTLFALWRKCGKMGIVD